MDELHVLIAAYLREHRRTTAPRRPTSDAERYSTALERDARILALWRERCDPPAVESAVGRSSMAQDSTTWRNCAPSGPAPSTRWRADG